MNKFDAAYARLCMARKSLDFSDVAEALGCRDSHAKNVLRRARGLTPEQRHQVLYTVASPFTATSSTLGRTQLTWFERLPYGPLLSSSAPALTEVPRSHVSFDKIVWIAKLADRERLRHDLPLFDVDAKKEPEAKSPHFQLDTWWGPVWAFWQRSKSDSIKPSERHSRFHRSMNLKILLLGEERTVAKLSIDPFRKRCKAHQAERGPHLDIPCNRAALEKQCPAAHFEYIPPRFSLPAMRSSHSSSTDDSVRGHGARLYAWTAYCAQPNLFCSLRAP